MTFKETTNFEAFLNILPQDWQESLLPFWETYKPTTKIFVLKDNAQIIAGGLVFAQCPNDMLYAKTEADTWFKKGYLYLGYIYVLESRRNQNLGSIWLNKVKETMPNQKFWLTIEDLKLDAFYVKNGFKHVKTLQNSDSEEKLYVFEC